VNVTNALGAPQNHPAILSSSATREHAGAFPVDHEQIVSLIVENSDREFSLHGRFSRSEINRRTIMSIGPHIVYDDTPKIA